MTFSPLTTRTVATRKYGPRQGRTVSRMIVHHTAGGTNEGNRALLSVGARAVSATYLLETDGTLTGIVPEEHRPWTSGSFAADGDAVTVETVNTGGAPAHAVAAVQIDTLARLGADLSRRYGWGRLDRARVRGHREFAPTACPGPTLWEALDGIIAQGNRLLGSAVPRASTPAPAAGERLVIGATIRLADEWVAYRTSALDERIGLLPAGDYRVVGIAGSGIRLQRPGRDGWVHVSAQAGLQ